MCGLIHTFSFLTELKREATLSERYLAGIELEERDYNLMNIWAEGIGQ